MLKFGKIIETVSERMGQINIKEKYCPKLKSPLSTCDKCVEICPVNGIDFNKKDMRLNHNCIQCGLCAGVCPTGAISIQEPTESNLYKYVEEKGKENSSVSISCKYNEKISPTYRVPCLGSLTVEFLLAIDNLGYQINMIFSQEKCSNCISNKGIEIFLNNMKEMRKIEKDLRLKGGSIKYMEKIPKVKKGKKLDIKNNDLERREFMFSIFNFAKEIPNKALEYLVQEDEKDKDKNIRPNSTYKKYSFLKGIALSLEDKELEEIEIDGYFEPTLVNNCTFCKACVVLCPMGALKYSQEDSNLHLQIIEDACSGCGLCVDVCYSKALELKGKTLNNFLNSEAKVIAKGRVQKCEACGKLIKSSEKTRLCSSCIKSGKN